MDFRHKAFATSCAAILTSAAGATDFRPVTSSERWTDISGVAGEYREILAAPGSGYSEMEVWERADKPVLINVRVMTLSSDKPRFVRVREVEVPEARSPQSYERVDVGNDRYITSVQVCINNDRIKGIRLWGKLLSPNGTPKNEHNDQFSLPNCMGKWRERVSCGDDKVATGMRLYYTTDHFVHDYGFSGIALRCARVERA